MIPSRRSFITGLAAFIAAPAVVRATSLMPVRGIVMPTVDESMSILMTPSMYEELCSVTRKAFIPRLFVQLYHSSPVLHLMQEMAAEQN